MLGRRDSIAAKRPLRHRTPESPVGPSSSVRPRVRHSARRDVPICGGTPDCPRDNLPVRERPDQMSGMLKVAAGTVSAFIHPRCRTLLRGLETVKFKPGANYVEPGTRERHWSRGKVREQREEAAPTG
jgi:hypothetical protein